MFTSPGSVLQLRTKPSFTPQLNATSLTRLGSGASRCSGTRCYATRNSSNILEKKLLGTRLRAFGPERLHLWRSDGPGRSPKLKVVVRSALSSLPEKRLGLYDPSFDKDSCGVGFVAELSGESNRKTVSTKYRRLNLTENIYLFLFFLINLVLFFVVLGHGFSGNAGTNVT